MVIILNLFFLFKFILSTGTRGLIVILALLVGLPCEMKKMADFLKSS